MTRSEVILAIEDLTARFTLFTRSETAFERQIRASAIAIVAEGPVAPTGKAVSFASPWAAAIRDRLAGEWPDVIDTCLACGIVLRKQRPN